MYSEWASLQGTIESESNYKSVLHSYSAGVGRDVSVSVVRQLAGRLSINASAKHEPLPSNLETEKQIEWTMEVICFGLSLPLIEHEAIRDCVNIYVEWLTALTVPKPTVPPSIVNDPNPYVQKIFRHFVNLFKPRDRGDSSKQIVLCHRVLRTVQTIAKQSGKFTRHTWEVLLQFLLAVNDTILSPPIEAGSLSEQLCDRLLSVLFELWLLACTRCFPSPSLWRTFREYCVSWRHHTALIEQWNRVNSVLTSHLLKILYGPHFPELKISEEDAQIIAIDMDDACIAQTWFRFLHILSNPVDLCKPNVVSKTPMFIQAAFNSEEVIDPNQHPCLNALPRNFLLAMKGIASLSNAFIGEPDRNLAGDSNPQNKTPPQSLKHSKSNYATSVYRDKPSKSITPSPLLTPTPEGINLVQLLQMEKRSQCNSILHLFGAWLFEGAVSGCKLQTVKSGEGSVGGSKPRRVHFAMSSFQSSHAFMGRLAKERHSIQTPDSYRMNGRRVTQASEIRKTSEISPTDITAILAPYKRHDISESPNNYEAGRAEACGALCRIFCNRNQGESILPVYLSRFYLALSQGLKIDETVSGLVLSSILFNSQDLFRIDLKGVSVVLPHFISALEMVLPEKELKFNSVVSQQQLRQASIYHLLAMLCVPHHFNTLSVMDLMTGKAMMTSGMFGENERVVTFRSLKLRIVNLMIGALQCELDPGNTQMLLGAIHLCILDSSLCEDIELKAEQRRKEESHRDLGTTILEEVMEKQNHQSESQSSKVMTHQRSSSEPIVDLTPLTSDTAWSIFVRCTHLVCQRLMSAWSTDYNVALAALELLSGLAKINVSIVQDQLECKRAVRWICEHIVHLCSRPSQYHSRDLHSIIVAAFQCLTVWIVNHEYLLKDKECLHCVLEVIELGISGSKSRPKGCVPPVYKHEKELKPASMRVKDAAEAVLACLLNHVGSFPSPIGPSSVVSLLDEEAILKLVKEKELATGDVAFRYFVLENNTLLAILEHPVVEEKDPLPTATILLRGIMGRHAWVMQQRHWPKSEKEAAQERLKYPARPQPMDNVGTHHEITSKNFPDMVDKIQQTDADRSIPTMASIETETSHADHEKLKVLLEKQMQYETFVQSSAEDELASVGFPNPRTEAKAPRPKQEFSPARLLLSHLGFLTLDALKEPANSSVPPSLVMLDSTQAGFETDLELLDSIPCRTFDTAFIFYVKSGQRTPKEILNNVLSSSMVSPHFLEFLNNLGWPVDIATHAGWSGHVSTSWKMDPEVTGADVDLDAFIDHGGSIYNGQHQVLYYADCTSEMAFVVPSQRILQSDRRHSDETSDQLSGKPILSPYGSKSLPMYQNPQQRPSTLDLPSESSGAAQISPSLDKKRKLSTRAGMIGGSQMKVLVVWLECLADGETFPLSDLLAETSTGLEYLQGNSSSSLRSGRSNDQVAVIFIQPLKSGLYRIQLHGSAVNTNPLVDGMVVSRRSLGTLVRQTCVNICNRKRLECDMHCPPHVKRRQKIQEMVNKYRRRQTSPQFYTQLFMD